MLLGRWNCVRSLITCALSACLAVRCVADVQCGPVMPNGIQMCEAGVDSNAFDTEAKDDYQHEHEWCWAASISMVFQFYRHPVSQERIVKETFGQIEDWPAQPATILAALNRNWKDDNDS